MILKRIFDFFLERKRMDIKKLKENGFSLLEYKGPLDDYSKQSLPLITCEGKIYLCIRKKDIEKIKKYRKLIYLD